VRGLGESPPPQTESLSFDLFSQFGFCTLLSSETPFVLFSFHVRKLEQGVLFSTLVAFGPFDSLLPVVETNTEPRHLHL